MREPISSPIRAEIIVVGYELLNGTTLDTNSYWLSRELTSLNVLVTRKLTIGDNLHDITTAFGESIRRKPTWIFSIGGLGPTYDDMTLEGLARALRKPLTRDPKAIQLMRDSRKRLGEKRKTRLARMGSSSLKMAMIPKGALPLKNSEGVAPGVLVTTPKSHVVSLPGVPREMKAIFLNNLKPIMSKSRGTSLRDESWLRVIGVGESKLARDLDEIALRFKPGIYIKSHPVGFHRGNSVLNIQIIETRQEGEKGRLIEATTQITERARKHGARVVRMKKPN